MGSIKEINIKNETCYFFNMINIKNFDSNLLKIERQKVIQKHWYLLQWIHHNKKYCCWLLMYFMEYDLKWCTTECKRCWL